MLVSRRAEMMPKHKLVLASFLGICAAIIVRQICAAIQNTCLNADASKVQDKNCS